MLSLWLSDGPILNRLATQISKGLAWLFRLWKLAYNKQKPTRWALSSTWGVKMLGMKHGFGGQGQNDHWPELGYMYYSGIVCWLDRETGSVIVGYRIVNKIAGRYDGNRRSTEEAKDRGHVYQDMLWLFSHIQREEGYKEAHDGINRGLWAWIGVVSLNCSYANG